jgi:hypothetical protein
MDYGIATRTSFCLPFPLRPDYMAHIIIPRDMTEREAERLCEFIMTLPIPDQKDALRAEGSGNG